MFTHDAELQSVTMSIYLYVCACTHICAHTVDVHVRIYVHLYIVCLCVDIEGSNFHYLTNSFNCVMFYFQYRK